ncbi:helix-turn-helix transcriptional regulator [Burkholderia multivorans]|uniref:AraC family transcriptional regulator n=1 Tax=Burkholderia multivorans TaxID=87883 RepID=UPI001C97B5DB|nr:helix-turn-helix transcriptional regulator [Burkholderia multivorans]MBY4674787.1 helix-turn-helix transcriptional regulator [Burkholderia multivorans]
MGFSSPSVNAQLLDLSGHETSALPVTGVVSRYPAGHVVPEHSHHRGHLLYAAEGVLLVEAATGRWLVPPTAAVWLRPGVPHRLVMPVSVQVHGIFIREDLAKNLPAVDSVLHISNLLRELIVALTRVDIQSSPSKREKLLGALFAEELGLQRSLPFHLPWPSDSQIQRVCDVLVHDPAHSAVADDWAAILAMSPKTFHRRFQKSTGLTFGRWRQQMRLMSSMTLLLKGAPITQVALSSGYESHSAYAVAFKKHFGLPPSEFFVSAQHRDS